jgi:hypothetical protein
LKRAERRAPGLNQPRYMSNTEVATQAHLQQMMIPRNEQDRVSRMIESTEDQLVAKYLACLVNPKGMMSRVPDSFPRPTALVRSISTFEIVCNVDGTSNSGRFSAAIQPTLGNLGSVEAYKIALVDSSAGWPTDFTDPASFVSVINGRDVRLDQFYQTLTQPPLGSSTLVSSAAGTGAIPFGAAVTAQSGYGLNYNYDPLTGRFSLPIGIYMISAMFTTPTGPHDANPVLNVHGGAVFIPEYDDYTDDAVSRPNVGAIAGYVSIPRNNATFSFTVVDPVVLTANLTLATTFNDNTNLITPDDGGVVAEYRPVGMSALATFIGPVLTNGGIISTAYVPGNTLQTQYFTQGIVSPQGQLANWENLALVPGSYNGKIENGTYSWWAPESTRDLNFNSPSRWSALIPPALIVSGAYQPGSGTTGLQVPIRLEVVTVYELVTTSQLWEQSPLVGSSAAFDRANREMAAADHAMANAEHSNFFKDFLSGLGEVFGWVGKAAPFLGELASFI